MFNCIYTFDFSSEFEEALSKQDLETVISLANGVSQHDLNTGLLRSIPLANDAITSALLDQKANPDAQDRDGRTAFYNAVRLNKPSLCKLLLDHGSDINLQRFNRSNILHFVAKNNFVNYTTLLITHGANLNDRNKSGNTPLLLACRFGNFEIAELLVQAGADANVCNNLGHFPLHYVAYFDGGDLITNMLKTGVDPDCRTYLGVTPIMIACIRKNCYAVYVLADGLNLDSHENLYGGTVMHWAVNTGCKLCVDYLITKGASLEMIDFSGRTPLLQTVVSDKPKIIPLILAELDRTRSNWKGLADENVLHLAAYLGNLDCIKALLKSTVIQTYVHKTDYFGDTPITVAAKQGKLEIIETLLDHGADSRECGIAQNVVSAPQTREEISTYNLELAVKALMKYTTGKSRGTHKPYKTYSPVKLGLIRLLNEEDIQLMAPPGFKFSTWLDNGPELFTIKINGFNINRWLPCLSQHPASLKEQCRLHVRRHLGYRTCEKIEQLSIAQSVKEYLNMKELHDLDDFKIKVDDYSSKEDEDDLDIEL